MQQPFCCNPLSNGELCSSALNTYCHSKQRDLCVTSCLYISCFGLRDTETKSSVSKTVAFKVSVQSQCPSSSSFISVSLSLWVHSFPQGVVSNRGADIKGCVSPLRVQDQRGRVRKRQNEMRREEERRRKENRGGERRREIILGERFAILQQG